MTETKNWRITELPVGTNLVVAHPEPPSAEQEVLRQRAHRLIPGGAHTYSKGDDQFPWNAPAFLVRGSGAQVWDPDGNCYLDWGMGLRAVVLGHAYPSVVAAAQEQLLAGVNFVRPSTLEGDLAELLLDVVPGAEMVKFAKDGSDTTSAAMRLARAYTGRDLVVICRDNPFYSFNDWFIGATPTNAGIPDAVSQLTLHFAYHDLNALAALFEQHPERIAAVIVEPAATAPGPNGELVDIERVNERNRVFLAGVKQLAHQNGAIFVLDEMITGFRWDLPGAQSYYGVEPDLACFGKALGNGFSLSALVGKRDIMDQGGIYQRQRPKVFLLSATHGGETHAIAAAMATIHEFLEHPVVDHLWQVGSLLQAGLNEAAAAAGMQHYFSSEHYPCSPTLNFWDDNHMPSPQLRTLFAQEMVRQGILMPYVAPSYSHTEDHVAMTVDAAAEAFGVCRQALDEGFDGYLHGPLLRPVFRKYN